MTGFNKFPSIESFAHVYKGQQRYLTPARLRYGAKIKLHGTNAAVRIEEDGGIYAQSRTRDITPADDNCGFAAWVFDHLDAWEEAANCGPMGTLTFYGEWAGPGVQSGDAVAQLDTKYFFLFAVQIDDEVVVDPKEIEQLMPELDHVLALPWDRVYNEPLDFGDPEAAQAFADHLNEQVELVGAQDPFIHGIFGVDGPGEGWVFMPLENMDGEDFGFVDRDWFSAVTFKVKAARHAVKQGKAATRDIEVPSEVLEFVDMFVTEGRCQQALNTVCDGLAEAEKTGNFLRWMGEDIKKESVEELAEMGLKWGDVSKQVTNAARTWYREELGRIVP